MVREREPLKSIGHPAGEQDGLVTRDERAGYSLLGSRFSSNRAVLVDIFGALARLEIRVRAVKRISKVGLAYLLFQCLKCGRRSSALSLGAVAGSIDLLTLTQAQAPDCRSAPRRAIA